MVNQVSRHVLQSGKANDAVLDNKTDANGAEHDERGRFTGNGLAEAFAKAVNNNLQSAKNDVNMYINKAVNREAVLKTLPKSITIKSDTPLRDKGFLIPANSKLTKVYGFAVANEIRILSKLTKLFPDASADKWIKCSGEAKVVDNLGAEFISEVHFYYNEEVGSFEYKFPTRLLEEWRL